MKWRRLYYVAKIRKSLRRLLIMQAGDMVIYFQCTKNYKYRKIISVIRFVTKRSYLLELPDGRQTRVRKDSVEEIKYAE